MREIGPGPHRRSRFRHRQRLSCAGRVHGYHASVDLRRAQSMAPWQWFATWITDDEIARAAIDSHLSSLRASGGRIDADGCLPSPLRVQVLPPDGAAQAGGLLCLLLLWECA